MIKRIIFDLDNVLIDWKDEYDNAIQESFDEIGYEYNSKTIEDFLKFRAEYEDNIKFYSKKDMLDYINTKMERKIPDEFINLYIKKLGTKVPEKLPDSYYDTLEYLSNKYELVVLTNWFAETQIERLKRVDIFKYFKNVYTGEQVAKPFKQSFINAMNDFKPEECAMVGDNLENDIKGAKNAGILKLIWKDINNKKQENLEELNGVDVINKFEELKNIL